MSPAAPGDGASYDAECAYDADLHEHRAQLPSRRLTVVAVVLSGCIICSAGALIAPMALSPPPLRPSAASPLPPPSSPPMATPASATKTSPPVAPPPMRRRSRPVPSPVASPAPSPPESSPSFIAPSTLSAKPPRRLWPEALPSARSLPADHVNRRALKGDRLTTAKPQAPPSLRLQVPRPLNHPLPLIAHLNRRFALGAPSNLLFEAGVLMHVLDGFERSDVPWDFNASSPSGDRASVSIVNARHPDVYENLYRPIGWQRMPGFVLDDAPTKERLSCAYFRDAGTTGPKQKCDHDDPKCLPGCNIGWCKGDDDKHWHCAFPPWRLKEMMEAHNRTRPLGHQKHWAYNELVIDTWRKPWALAMPSMIKAVFVQAGSYESELKYGREVHSKLLAHFGLSEADIPLLEYDATSASEPFRPLKDSGSRKSASLSLP